jgi:hypothetical protein
MLVNVWTTEKFKIQGQRINVRSERVAASFAERNRMAASGVAE